MDNNSNIKIINWNTNGFQNKINGLEELLDRLGIDLCLITETELIKNKIIGKIKNYNLYRADRNSNLPGGGVEILVNKKHGNIETIIDDPRLKNLETIEALAIKLYNKIYIAVCKPPKPEVDRYN